MGKLAEFAAISEVEPIRIPGYWLRQPTSGPKILSGERVVLAFHGGAYVSLSASPNDPTAVIARGLLEHTPNIRHVFSAEYRLSSHKHGNPFPCALLDALAAYAHLIRRHGVSPRDIIVEGDSAGGNLGLALVRYLVEYRSELEPHGLAPPGALLLLSPWCDLGTSHDLLDATPYLKHCDFIQLGGPDARVKPAQRLFTGPHGLSAADTNVYISPGSLLLTEKPSFKGFPRTFIAVASAEALAPQIRVVAQRMQKDLGEDATLYEAPDAVHDYISLTWCEPERTDTLKAISAWVQKM
jgi:acetyl esterase/lipase